MSELIELHTPRKILFAAAKIVGELQHCDFTNFPNGFLLIQTAIDLLDSGIGIDDDATPMLAEDNLFSAFKNYQKIVGLPLPCYELTDALPSFALETMKLHDQ